MANGSNIPSGSAPLFFGDFATPTAAIGQRMTERMAKQYEADQTRQGKDRAAMLKALDFAAVEGLSEKVSREHLDSVNAVTDKWATAWLEKGKKFDDSDYFEIQRDKRKVEQDISNKKHNVAQLANAQNQLRTNPDLYHPKSLEELTSFVEEGNAGRDTAGLLQPKFNMVRYLQKSLGDVSGKMSTEETWNAEKGRYDITSTNEPVVREKIRALVESDPILRHHLQDPQVGQEYADIIDAFAQSKISKVTDVRSATSTEARERTRVNLTPEQQAIDAKHDWTGKGMERKHFQNMAELNTEISGVLRKDRDALNRLNGTYVRGLGIVNRATVDNEGNVTLLGGTEKTPKDMIIPVPKDWDNKKEVTASMLATADILRPDAMTSGKLPTNYTDFLETGWESQVGEVAGNTAFEDLIEATGKKEPKSQDIVNRLKDLFDDETIEKKEGIGWKDFLQKEGVKFAGKKYKVNTPADMKALIKAVEEKKGFGGTKAQADSPVIEETPPVVPYELNGVTYNIPPEEEAAFLEENPSAKKL